MKRFIGIVAACLSVLAQGPAGATTVFDSTSASSCDALMTRVSLAGQSTTTPHQYCNLPGNVVHWPFAEYSSSVSPGGAFAASVKSALGASVAGQGIGQGSFASATGRTTRSFPGSNAVDVTFTYSIDAISTSDEPGDHVSWAGVSQSATGQIGGCSDGSTASGSGRSEWSKDGSDLTLGSRTVTLTVACPPGQTMIGQVHATTTVFGQVYIFDATTIAASISGRVESITFTPR